MTLGKLEIAEEREIIAVSILRSLIREIMILANCAEDISEVVSEHLVGSNLAGVESHGVMRVMQYVQQFESGYMCAAGRPALARKSNGAWFVDGKRGIGIPAMKMAVEQGCQIAKETGVSAVALTNCGHTGRLGAYAELGAQSDCLTIIIGGGNRKEWPMVAPFGGKKAILPTNPYAFGIPGGDRGPVVMDFATAKIAGGWIYAAKSAGAFLPSGAVIDSRGCPTTDPDDYFDGGAILPFGGPKGYGLALVAELIGEAMLGPVTAEMNWFVICVDISGYNCPQRYRAVAEEILAEIRACPPASPCERVEIPGEREREHHDRTEQVGVALPPKTWMQMNALAARLRTTRTGKELDG